MAYVRYNVHKFTQTLATVSSKSCFI